MTHSLNCPENPLEHYLALSHCLLSLTHTLVKQTARRTVSALCASSTIHSLSRVVGCCWTTDFHLLIPNAMWFSPWLYENVLWPFLAEDETIQVPTVYFTAQLLLLTGWNSEYAGMQYINCFFEIIYMQLPLRWMQLSFLQKCGECENVFWP